MMTSVKDGNKTPKLSPELKKQSPSQYVAGGQPIDEEFLGSCKKLGYINKKPDDAYLQDVK